MTLYQATYTDAHGCESVPLHNDGETLRMTVRGVSFSGTDFDALEPEPAATPEQLASFRLHHNALCACRIRCVMPMPMTAGGLDTEGELLVELTLGEPAERGRLDRELLQLTLHCAQGQFAGSGKSGWFEEELSEIQQHLPAGVYMRCCFNCLYSDYSPYGSGCFGSMMCFRNIKSAYLAVRDKQQLLAIHERFERQVQETYLCAEFERRVPGTGYRG